MRVHGRRGREPHRLADVPHCRGVAVFGRVPLDEVEDLLLTLGQVHPSAPCSFGQWCQYVEHMFVNVAGLADGYKAVPRAAPGSAAELRSIRRRTGSILPPHAPVA